MIARISDKYQRILAIFLVFKEPNQILYIRSRHSMMFQWHHWGALESRRRLHSSNWLWRDADMRKWSARSFFSVPLSVVENIYLLIPFQLFFIIIYVYIYSSSSSSSYFFLSNFAPFSPLDGIMSAPARVFVYFPAETREAEGLQSVRMMEQQTRRSNGNM